jgi:hypothetical protein
MIRVLPDRQSWSSAIGLFVINFSALDLLVQDFLESTLPSEEFLRIKERPFYDRVKRIEAHVSQADYSEEKRQQFEKVFRRLDPIRELRNHIAHGVLRFELAEDQSIKAVTLSLPRDLDGSSSPAALHLEFEELSKALSELTALIEEFKKLTGG